MSTTVVDPTVEFQQKMRERIRANIGDLMPDAALAQIVEKGIHEAFFAPRRVPQNYGADKIEPSWFVKFLQDACKSLVEQAVKEWVSRNQEQVLAMAKETLEDGVAQAVLNSFARLWRGPIAAFDDKLAAAVSNFSNR
jgi:hypothetical protein